jgi:hypothetical protein
MRITHDLSLPRSLRHAVSLISTVSLSVLATLLMQHLLAPPHITAQVSDTQVVRASAFELVGADGTILARLAPDQAGNGLLTLSDAAGRPRSFVAGMGRLGVSDANGKVRASMFVNPTNNSSGVQAADEEGNRRANLVYDPTVSFGTSMRLFDASGHERFTVHYRADADDSGASFFDGNNRVRVAIGSLADDGYGVRVRDAENNILAEVP